MHHFIVQNNEVDSSEEYVLDMLYDNALDDGPMIVDAPPCLVISTNICEIKMILLIFVMMLSFMRVQYYA
jgi:hypothetical protein